MLILGLLMMLVLLIPLVIWVSSAVVVLLRMMTGKKSSFLCLSVLVITILRRLLRPTIFDGVHRNYVTLPGGGKSALPRYYADKIFRPKGHSVQHTYVDPSDGQLKRASTRYICPVSRLAYEMYLSDRSDLLNRTTRRKYKFAYDDHIAKYGGADDFIRSQNEARLAAIINSQRKADNRT